MGDFVANAIAVTPSVRSGLPFPSRFRQFDPDRSERTGLARFHPQRTGRQEIYVNPLTIAYQKLRKLNDSLQSDFVYK
jgi:hypothetical protein